jgi:hypothetical protein
MCLLATYRSRERVDTSAAVAAFLIPSTYPFALSSSSETRLAVLLMGSSTCAFNYVRDAIVPGLFQESRADSREVE